jgi:outer membrane cobalamin receptor
VFFGLRLSRFSFLLLISTFSFAIADETLTLARYLQNANDAGLRIIFSSSLIPPFLRVTSGEDNVITLEQVKRVLGTFDLMLDQVANDRFVVKRAPSDSVVQPPVEELFVPEPIDLEEIVVTSSIYKLMMSSTRNSATLSHEDLTRRPALANDALRTINTLPGAASSGVSVKPRVRGGNADEMLISFNGVRLYEPFHLQEFSGLFSTVDSRVVDSLEFMSGGFPVDYGDRLSAVMQINTKTPEELGSIRELGLGLYTLSYLQAGGSGNQHYMIDVRKSSIELLTSIAETDIGSPSFGDIFGRYDWLFDDGSTVSVNLFVYGDDADINNSSGSEIARSNTSNTYAWVDYSLPINELLILRSIFSVAAINIDRQGMVAKSGQVTGSLTDDKEFRFYNLQQEYAFDFGAKGLFDAGFEYRHMNAEYEYSSELSIEPAFSSLSNFERPTVLDLNMEESGRHLGLYAKYKWRPVSKLYAEVGIRMDWQDYIDGTTKQVSPRVNILYHFSRATEIRLGWGKFAQSEGIHELKVSDGLTAFQSPQESIHSVFSLMHVFNSGLRVRLEAYRKEGVDNRDYYENLTNSLTLIPELQVDRYVVRPDDFTAKGVELTVDGYTRRFDWWLNYTFSSAKDEIEGVKIPRSWDQENSANAGISAGWDGWQNTITVSYHSGWPTTSLSLGDDGIVVAARRNSVRFSNYLSFDFKTVKSWQFSKGRNLRLEAGITNLLNRDNQVGIEYDLENGSLIPEEKYSIPLAPFLDIYLSF